jgi:hypothetical protein
MPRDRAIIFSHLIGKLDVLYVHCDKCGRAGRYRLSRLFDERRHGATLSTGILHTTLNEPYGARCPDLPRVL